MPDTSEVISFSEAARKMQCGRNTLYRAVEDGRLNDVDVGGRRMIVKDDDWQSFEPKLIGRRAQKFNDESVEESS